MFEDGKIAVDRDACIDVSSKSVERSQHSRMTRPTVLKVGHSDERPSGMPVRSDRVGVDTPIKPFLHHLRANLLEDLVAGLAGRHVRSSEVLKSVGLLETVNESLGRCCLVRTKNVYEGSASAGFDRFVESSLRTSLQNVKSIVSSGGW